MEVKIWINVDNEENILEKLIESTLFILVKRTTLECLVQTLK